jgi:hypothetical protein
MDAFDDYASDDDEKEKAQQSDEPLPAWMKVTDDEESAAEDEDSFEEEKTKNDDSVGNRTRSGPVIWKYEPLFNDPMAALSQSPRLTCLPTGWDASSSGIKIERKFYRGRYVVTATGK